MTQLKALAKILSMADFEREAEKRLPRPIFGYVSGACEDCQSLRANRDVFAEYEFISRTLVDVSSRSQQVEIFGKTYSAPFGMAPMGITAMSQLSNLVLGTNLFPSANNFVELFQGNFFNYLIIVLRI